MILGLPYCRKICHYNIDISMKRQFHRRNIDRMLTPQPQVSDQSLPLHSWVTLHFYFPEIVIWSEKWQKQMKRKIRKKLDGKYLSEMLHCIFSSTVIQLWQQEQLSSCFFNSKLNNFLVSFLRHRWATKEGQVFRKAITITLESPGSSGQHMNRGSQVTHLF